MSALAPYVLPSTPVQIAFSGGRTSGYMLHQILEANGGLPDNAVITFQNTGREMPETLDFVAQVGDRWGVPIVWLEYRPGPPVGFEIVGHNSASRNGEPFEALIRRRRFLPNQKSRFCTVELKIRTAKRYLRSLDWKRWTNYVGLRADERDRLVNLPRTWTPQGRWEIDTSGKKPKRVWIGEPRAKDRWIVATPLATAGISKHDVALFDLKLMSFRGKTPLGNCDGCFLKSETTVSMIARDHPDRHAWWEDMEVLASTLSQADGMTKSRGAWFSKRYTRRRIREVVETQGDWIFDDEDFLCQVDDGECAPL